MEIAMSESTVEGALVSPVTLSNEPPVVRFHHSKILALFRAFDSALIVFMLWSVLNVLGLEWTNIYTMFAISAVIIFGFFAESNEVYYLWRGHSMADLAIRLLLAWFATLLFMMLAAVVVYPFASVGLLAVASWLVVTPAAMVAMHIGRRVLLAKLRAKPTEPRRVAIVGANDLGLRLINSMSVMPWLGYRVIGFYDDRAPNNDVGRRLVGKNIEVKGGLDQLYQDAHDGKLDIVFVALPMRAELRMHTVIDRLADTTVSPYVIPDVFSFDLLHSRLTCLQGIPALSIYDSPLVDNGWAKRLEDLVLGLGILAVLAIPMLLIAIGVKLTSSGPVFFKQTRYGMGGEHIKV